MLADCHVNFCCLEREDGYARSVGATALATCQEAVWCQAGARTCREQRSVMFSQTVLTLGSCDVAPALHAVVCCSPSLAKCSAAMCRRSAAFAVREFACSAVSRPFRTMSRWRHSSLQEDVGDCFTRFTYASARAPRMVDLWRSLGRGT